MTKKKKIAVVTGGAGFIGSHMVELLIEKNFEVRIIDNFCTGSMRNLSHLKNKIKIKNIDICKISKQDSFFKHVDYVFHFAGIADLIPSIKQPVKYIENNFMGTIKVLEASIYNNIKKIVYAASASCYGKTSKPVSEEKKINIEHPYGFSKYLGEQAIMQWCKIFKLPAISLRLFNVYGTRSRTSGAYGAVLGVFLKQKIANKPLTVVGDGKQTRDFVFVKDVVYAFYLAAISKKSGEIYNVGSNIESNINKLASLISDKKINIPDRPGEARRSCAVIHKIKKDLKWKAKVKLNSGINYVLQNIEHWKKAPLWTKKNINIATKEWFKILGK